MADWRVDVLKGIGAPLTRKNMQFLTTWQRWEGGHTKNNARFNWLNTTSSSPGATHSINSVGVKAFDSYENGIGATIQTLNNGNYGDIVEALRGGDPYAAKPVKGLGTWVAGPGAASSKHALSYASRVLGAPVTDQHGEGHSHDSGNAKVGVGGQTYGGGGKSPQRLLASSGGDSAYKQALAGFMLGRAQARLRGEDPQGGLLQMAQLRDTFQQMGGVPEEAAQRQTADKSVSKKQPVLNDVVEGNILVPTIQPGTHITDNLDWNNGRKTARDIMARPGTVVGAPEDGVVLKHGGAQGGESMYFKGKSGRVYWLGHISNFVPVGQAVRAGKPLARISPDHARPHLHFDYKL